MSGPDPADEPPREPADVRAIRTLLFGEERDRRFTQDTPILPDVWFAFAEKPDEPCDLLMTPLRSATAGRVAFRIRGMLDDFRKAKNDALKKQGSEPEEAAPYRLAHMPGMVVAKISLTELMRIVLPSTNWWDARYRALKRLKNETFENFPIPTEHLDRQLASALERYGLMGAQAAVPHTAQGESDPEMPIDLLWMVRLVGRIVLLRRQVPVADQTAEAIASAFTAFYKEWPYFDPSDEPLIGRVTVNRRARTSVGRSVLAVKGDAARRLFEVSTRDITWAVIDCGIDSQHPAFRDHSDKRPSKGRMPTRVVKTYDFTDLRQLLDPDDFDRFKKEALEGALPGTKSSKDQAIGRLRERIYSGQDVDWAILEPFVQRCDPKPPHFEHGTHVAGIIGADWRADDRNKDEEPMVGMCPEIRLIDVRVLDHESGEADEFEVIAALQFLRFLNTRAGEIVVHGANLSLSLPHDVENYACGRTPICRECEKAVANGLVVVTAAGNYGYRSEVEMRGRGIYRPSSISDPGNAEAVITVGATHRHRAHEYGVSYFSGRGPTGDGRRKPDLVAPGEKIMGPLPNRRAGPRDGTSMAAPHVSGAAALLMARHPEFIGKPARVKQVLCDSATDLGRYSFYQGAGMLDTLRALQSV